MNRDNDWLVEAIGGRIGYVSEVNGADAEEAAGFVPTHHELSLLVKYWMTQILDYDYFLFCYQQTCSAGVRRSLFGGRRIKRIEAVIGEDVVQRAIDEAYAEFGQKKHPETWRIFLHGTDEERRAIHAELYE